ncbi:MAG TPA: hypothetical protein DCQ26_00170 [Marinilabiliales bacterium]|jgi:beta-phosphoglucomutase-like phosphatase (HAD superfamily)|nr:MAG: hypothetical protein A2W95_03665 [Bacteroidetes bacterium GWA2_40_14]OFX61210.1 MAG: hypothetical protein A2W84_00620 [Bacteroidetes bacterium GWC2_40_13]OFX75256.1 MAG: hypothetical protein A2W96_16805 [Bacteroidetes bacterium GWD2_40_43]OFX89853.1 MAG: hypothetical protein A2W97_12465 [Bacteroidetes bacterium GWE2_40_63]OFY21954.1 MAG: hypothetical protein A2W88_00380 [Bacteroidetes bacterium GWF2_40_13]OFZ30301.1 MAG: hypothetical protein A2437_09830 [Bacteroidetes bacterium RIFOXYC
MATFKGIIFDFNGTLFLDSPLHEKAWIEMAVELRDKKLTVEEFRIHGHGRTNKTIIQYLLGYLPEMDELERITEQKEKYYRELCLQNSQDFKLASGAEWVLNKAKELALPITIATGSYARNVEFYFQYLNLGKWFRREWVVLDDGTYPGKPAPDIFMLAAQKLHLAIHDCLVFEDSYSGIESAWKAGVGHIVAVEPRLNHDLIKVPKHLITYQNGFEGFDLNTYFS